MNSSFNAVLAVILTTTLIYSTQSSASSCWDQIRNACRPIEEQADKLSDECYRLESAMREIQNECETKNCNDERSLRSAITSFGSCRHAKGSTCYSSSPGSSCENEASRAQRYQRKAAEMYDHYQRGFRSFESFKSANGG